MAVESSPHVSHRDDSLLLREFKAQAARCETPKQFHKLLDNLRTFIPYEKFAGVWGYPSRSTLRFIFNHSFPVDFLRWHLTTGAMWTSPAFRQWLRTNRAVLWCDVAKRLGKQLDPDLVKHVTQANLENMLCGGLASQKRFVLFTAAMPSAESGRAHLSQFEVTVPWLVAASQRAYPSSLLTKRQVSILERRAMGQIIKQIAAAEGISEATVREHIQQIKRKLCTDDLVNAVVIAVKSGMLLPQPQSKKTRTRSPR